MVKKISRHLSRFKSVFQKLFHIRAILNGRMKEQYSPNGLALISTGVCLIISIMVLFLPPYLGVANDSIGNQKMLEYGLAYRPIDIQDNESFLSNEYFTRCYEQSEGGQEINTVQNLVVHLAKAIDYFFTRDHLFDVRFLALIYFFLYLPAVFLVLRSALERVSFFSEGILLAVCGTIIFSDISYITYFNSLYEDPLIFICLMYLAGTALSLQLEKSQNISSMLIFTLAGVTLSLMEKRFFIAGLLLSAFLFSQLRVIQKMNEKIIALFLSCVLVCTSVISLFWCGEEFDDLGKYHAMTRGVLLQAEKPDHILEQMGIDVSYSVLADSSLYDHYPIAELNNDYLQKGFLDQYTISQITVHYLKHPGAMLSMWSMGIKSAFNLRRDYCGNYERSTQRPEMGKSIFWSLWSIYKVRYAPKTLGYLVVLIIAYFWMSGRSVFSHRRIERWSYVYFTLMVTLTLAGMADLTYVICKSGDTQLVQFNITIGVILDMLTYYVMAEMLHKLNILEARHENG